jgi:tripartite-type tricarboxylate transporter receptor subunit TctC
MRKLVAAVAALASSVAIAQQWNPSQPVRFIVPQVAGGGADTIGRSIAHGIGERLGQSIVVDNRPGANGGVGAEALLRAPADGHSLLLVFTSLMALNPAVYEKTPYDPIKDFAVAGSVCQVPLVMMGSLSVPGLNAAEMVAAAKKNPNLVFAASSGNGAFSHLLVEMLNSKAGLKLTHVPFKGEAPAVTHLLGNQGPAIYMGTPALAISNIRAGKLKGLGVTTAKRMEQLPDVPTLAEQGVGDFDESFWYGVAMAAGTPAAIVKTYERHLMEAAKSEAMIKAVGKSGCTPFPLDAAAFAQRVKADLAKYSAIAKAVGMKLD